MATSLGAYGDPLERIGKLLWFYGSFEKFKNAIQFTITIRNTGHTSHSLRSCELRRAKTTASERTRIVFASAFYRGYRTNIYNFEFPRRPRCCYGQQLARAAIVGIARLNACECVKQTRKKPSDEFPSRHTFRVLYSKNAKYKRINCQSNRKS